MIPVGDQAFEVRVGTGIDRQINSAVHSLAQQISTSGLSGIIETVPAYDTLLIIVDRNQLNLSLLDDLITAPPSSQTTGDNHIIPVCYGDSYGPDLSAVADHAGLTTQQVVDLHCQKSYHVYCIGFSPGFAYLGDLDSRIACSRLSTPRLAVPPGSIAIGGQQTGIYPLSTPGGWRLIGRTPLSLFSIHSDQPSLLSPGDQIQFVPISPLEFVTSEQTDSAPDPASGTIGVLTAANLSIQDLGRHGWRRWGVGSDGALDMLAHHAANLLVGNELSAATLESFGSCELEILQPVTLSVTGGAEGLFINDKFTLAGHVVHVLPGSRVTVPPPVRSMTWYLAAAGGFNVPPVLGSRSLNSAGCGGGTNGRPVQPGDQLLTGRHTYHTYDLAGRHLDRDAFSHDTAPLRVIPGPDHSDTEPWGHDYEVTSLWSRTGIRLTATTVTAAPDDHDYISTGVIPGIVQFPGSGNPIVLHRGAGTLGGYPRLMTIVSSDLDRMACFVPGTSVSFKPISMVEAEQARHDYHMRLLSIIAATSDCRAFSLTINHRRYAVTVTPCDKH